MFRGKSREARQGRRGIWRQRGRRVVTGMNVLAAALLAGILVLLLNLLAAEFPVRWRWNTEDYYALSDKTLQQLEHMGTEITVVVYFRPSHPLFDHVRKLIREYEHATRTMDGVAMSLRFVDPDRDLAVTRELARRYDLSTPNVVIFEANNRRKYVEANDIASYEMVMGPDRTVHRQKASFLAEQMFSSALQTLSQEQRPVVYFLTGHGERDLDDFGRNAGYSSLARALRRDNIDVRPLRLTAATGVPSDCSALVVAGPDRRLSDAEVEMIATYLQKSGRAFFLIDPVVSTGLEMLLSSWGVHLAEDVAVGLTLTGRELIVTEYGEHPVTRRMRGITTAFYMPRVIEPTDWVRRNGVYAPADKPRVTVLAGNTAEGWAESDLSQSPPRFDAGEDRPGPVPVVLAVELGTVSPIDLQLRPTRLVVAGDSYFVSNGALQSGVGGNLDFFMGALNWLLEREALMAIAPKDPQRVTLDMNRDQLRLLLAVLAAGIPGVMAALGVLVWVKRR